MTRFLTKGHVLYLFLAILVAFAGWGICFPAEKPPEEFSPDRYMPPQLPVTEFKVKTVRAALKDLTPAELVLGVVLGQEARAYPINMLNRRPGTKVLNDTLAGQPIIASWCDRAHNAIVYSRQVEGKTLTFGIFGQLWKDSLVMYDQETMTRWSHLPGQAKLGPLENKKLQPLPSLVTDWETWSRLYPEGTVVLLPDKQSEFIRQMYDQPDDFLLGIAVDNQAKTWGFRDLRKTPVRNDSWGGDPVVVVFTAPSSTARLFRRTVGKRVLTFARRGDDLIDQETETTWDSISGQAQVGVLAGQQLSPLPAIVSSKKVWEKFYPERK